MRGILFNGYVISEEELAPVRQFIKEDALRDVEDLAAEDWAWTTHHSNLEWVNQLGLKPDHDGWRRVDQGLWRFLENIHQKRWGKKP
jgi:hypothetical protein